MEITAGLDVGSGAVKTVIARTDGGAEETVLAHVSARIRRREIAKVVGLHESRVSQLKSQAILRLRSHLRKRWPTRGRV